MSREMSRLGSGNEIIRSEHSMLEKNDWVKMNWIYLTIGNREVLKELKD